MSKVGKRMVDVWAAALADPGVIQPALRFKLDGEVDSHDVRSAVRRAQTAGLVTTTRTDGGSLRVYAVKVQDMDINLAVAMLRWHIRHSKPLPKGLAERLEGAGRVA